MLLNRNILTFHSDDVMLLFTKIQCVIFSLHFIAFKLHEITPVLLFLLLSSKYEAVRGELQFVQRDLQSCREEAEAAVTGKERLTQELHTKQAQVCSLEGQLDAARNQNIHLSQEIKRSAGVNYENTATVLWHRYLAFLPPCLLFYVISNHHRIMHILLSMF